ncbi:glutathione S-transferase family protein [Pleionea sediminis]|uniref:glutathione S-transferase family protein n=1 Tax=Pleionea sediminis TaxID=2569479 RepID=UPI00118546C2|nr:glutathione S-transferase family protein [Pleionea sediminis]
MNTIYGMSASGNCYKLALVSELLEIPYHWNEVDILNGETQTPHFLQINSNGKVPVLELDDGKRLPESNAALFYLAQNSNLFPKDTFQQAQVLQWMFFEQYSHEPAIAVARFIKKFLPAEHERQNQLPALHQRGYQALDVMEQQLSMNQWISGNDYSIADIALFAYTHVAEEGGYSLSDYSNIVEWIAKIKRLPNFISMEEIKS